MGFKGIQFLEDYNIEYRQHGENIGSEWIGINCPRCRDYKYHLGYNETTKSFSCWRCGKMKLIEAVQYFANVDRKKAVKIIKDYGGFKSDATYKREAKEKDIDVIFPRGTLNEFPKRHKKYLESRNFDPEYLINTWDLKATGHLGNYRFRIIAPIYFNNTLVSYQGRDITGKSEIRYKTCAKEFERIHHKHILYGIDYAQKSSVLVVEGVTDVWRMGFGSLGTFGTSFTTEQVLLLHKHYKRIFIWFDQTDPEAQEQAHKLTYRLITLGTKEVYQLDIDVDCDPANLKEEESDYIMRDLLLR